MAKTTTPKPHVPTLTRVIREELGFARANYPAYGGFTVTVVHWDMVPVVLIGWCPEPNSPEATGLTDEVRKIADLLKGRGYLLKGFREDRNSFFVLPEALKLLADA